MLLKRSPFFLVFFLFISNLSFGQGIGRSPYSTIGIGELTDETNASQDMMGGTGVSFSNTFYVNNLNPALVSKDRVVNGLKYVALGVGGTGYFRNSEQANHLNQDFGLNLSNLTMAFPVNRYWTLGVNFKPYSIVDNVNEIKKPFGNGSSAVAKYTFSDYGGLTKVGFTNSFNPLKGLYVGIEAQSYFGNIVRDTSTLFISSAQYSSYSGRSSFTGLSLKGGLAYQQRLTKNWKANFGATYQMGNNLKIESLHLHQSMSDNGNGLAPVGKPDTISNTTGKVSLPMKYKVGVSIEKTYNWLFAAEYGFTDWEGIQNPYDARAKNILRNSQEANFGVEWLPSVGSSHYFSQIFYRAGFKAVVTPYVINGIRVKDNSVSVGMSLPLGRGGSYLDLGVTVGRRGTIAGNLVREDYAKISLSFSLMRDWFHRPIIQ